MNEFVFTVDKNSNGILAQDFLLKNGVSKEIIKKVKFGGVFLNGKTLSTLKTPIRFGDVVKMVLPTESVNPYVKVVKGDLSVLYEDDYILAVDKPSGIATHASKSGALSLDSLVLGYLAPSVNVFRAVNRLDRDTSGVVIIAKDEFTASMLSNQIKAGDFSKVYYAVACGVPMEETFIVEKPIKRLTENGMERVCDINGKYAKTIFTLIKTLGNGNSLIKAEPVTGRTHQIRVHLKSVNLPLYADALYGERVENKTFFLNARVLEFTHPHLKKRIKIQSKIEI